MNTRARSATQGLPATLLANPPLLVGWPITAAGLQDKPPRLRTIADPAQLAVLRRLYDSAGDDATKAEIESAAQETGLYVYFKLFPLRLLFSLSS